MAYYSLSSSSSSPMLAVLSAVLIMALMSAGPSTASYVMTSVQSSGPSGPGTPTSKACCSPSNPPADLESVCLCTISDEGWDAAFNNNLKGNTFSSKELTQRSLNEDIARDKAQLSRLIGSLAEKIEALEAKERDDDDDDDDDDEDDDNNNSNGPLSATIDMVITDGQSRTDLVTPTCCAPGSSNYTTKAEIIPDRKVARTMFKSGTNVNLHHGFASAEAEAKALQDAQVWKSKHYRDSDGKWRLKSAEQLKKEKEAASSKNATST